MATADEDHSISYAWIEGSSILVAVFICSMVASVNNY